MCLSRVGSLFVFGPLSVAYAHPPFLRGYMPISVKKRGFAYSQMELTRYSRPSLSQKMNAHPRNSSSISCFEVNLPVLISL